MGNDPDRRLCPFCGQVQLPESEALWRCSGCNLFVRASDLLGEGEAPRLEAVSRDFCPWCAFPAAREHSLPQEEEFACVGCSGSLTVDMLETQAAIDAYRRRSLSPAGYLLFFLTLVAILTATFLLIR